MVWLRGKRRFSIVPPIPPFHPLMQWNSDNLQSFVYGQRRFSIALLIPTFNVLNIHVVGIFGHINFTQANIIVQLKMIFQMLC